MTQLLGWAKTEQTLGPKRHINSKWAHRERPHVIGHQGNESKATEGATHLLERLRRTIRAVLSADGNVDDGNRLRCKEGKNRAKRGKQFAVS